jgi:predicted dehydrogenase
MNSQKVNGIGLIGCGHRGIAGFLKTIKELNRADSVIALCDSNQARLEFAKEYLNVQECKTFLDYDSFLAEPRLNTIIVATPDNTHVNLVVKAFNHGKHVICEKPMATNIEDCHKMIQAKGEHEFRVAFNLRYDSTVKKLKSLIDDNCVGEILHVAAHDIVSKEHGSDYFRRWHRLTKNSGSLLMHKSTHMFDVINWFVNSTPKTVSAQAAKTYYLPEYQKGDNCTECSGSQDCKFYVDISKDIPGQEAGIDEFYKRLYVDGLKHDNYQRDKCVFHKENDLNDTYNVQVEYRNGILFSYTGLFYAPYEERRLMIQGNKGRIEANLARREITIFKNNEMSQVDTIVLPEEIGGHGGADINLMKAVFGIQTDDIQEADSTDGYWSVALADAANRSITTGEKSNIKEL